MNMPLFARVGCWLAVITVGTVVLAPGGAADDQTPRATAAWTLDECLAHLRYYPNDLHAQFAAIQLGKKEGRTREVETILKGIHRADQPEWSRRAEQVNLFSMMNGSLAIQESLQLDALQEGSSQPDAPDTVAVKELAGPSVKSHPWSEMLAGRTPEISSLAHLVPEDHYFIQFQSLTKLLELLDLGDLWGTHLFSQTRQVAYSHQVAPRIQRQLALRTSDLLRPFYDGAVSEVAITGSDLYAMQGSDVTLLFRYSQKLLFEAQMNGFLVQFEQESPGASRTTGTYRDVPYVHLSTPDRSVHVFSAYPVEGVHVRSNSWVAFQQVIDTMKGRDDSKVRSLGDTDEYAYIRTLMPYGAEEEDGFVYFSDPFIRRLVGPEVKLTQRRRVLCSQQLHAIGKAAALFWTQEGHAAKSIAALRGSAWSPFHEEGLHCPCGGHYSLAEDGLTAVCSHHGRVAAMVPCCEIPLTRVTEAEANAYRAFVTEYNRFWRVYFDPIAVRIRVAAEQYRIETIVLPLIDNSIYSQMATMMGGTPEPLDALPVPERNIFSMAVRIDKQRMLRESGWEPPPPRTEAKGRDSLIRKRSLQNLKQLALAMHNYHDSHRTFPAVANFDAEGRPLLSWRVHLLPFLNEADLYKEFHLDEPWDSDHNKKLIELMPPVYRALGRKQESDPTTTYLLPTGERASFTGTAEPISLRKILDGSSNTLMIVEADEGRATVWTKPGDLPIDSPRIRKDLFDRFGKVMLAAAADGSAFEIPETISDDQLVAIFTRNGGEHVDSFRRFSPRRRTDPFGLDRLGGGTLDKRTLYDFVALGIGNQMGVHVYDADPLFDFQLLSFLGQATANFSGRRAFWMDDNFIGIVLLVASLNSPVYVSLPLEDVQVADAFLSHVDGVLAEYVRKPQRSTFFQFEDDFYRMPIGNGQYAQSLGIRVGPVKWRFFWARIDNGLYIASKPSILEDLAAMAQSAKTQPHAGTPAKDSTAHALVRIRPEHWNEVLPAYRLGWAESHRLSCLDNVGRLTSLSRLAAAHPSNADNVSATGLNDLADRLLGVRFHCPEGGHYVVAPDGKKVTCSIHGCAADPRQAAIAKDNGAIDRILRGFHGLRVTLTFLEDGLHAVMTIDRK